MIDTPLPINNLRRVASSPYSQITALRVTIIHSQINTSQIKDMINTDTISSDEQATN